MAPDIVAIPMAGPPILDAGPWLTYTAPCPCGQPAQWSTRTVQVGPPERPWSAMGARYTQVEYRIDCGCGGAA